jgi:fructuronate reductase
MGTPLSAAALPSLRARGVRTPQYDLGSVSCGIVHFGPGAFHRVHQAGYVDALLAADPRWGICEVALQTPAVRDALQAQDGLYTLCRLDRDIDYRIVGAAREFLVAREEPYKVLQKIAAPTTHLISATVTEKGYCLAPTGGLDFDHRDIKHDSIWPEAPVTFVGYLAEGLRLRRAANLPGLNVLACDNLTDNGHRLRRAVLEFAHSKDAGLAAWIDQEVAFPCTMVDSITPATDDALRDRVERETGCVDRWPVQREAFVQWVVEDSLRGVRPDLSSVGVEFTQDVQSYEQAKLRLLNGSHSTLAYVGLLAGYEFVADAVTDKYLGKFVDALMHDIMPSISAPRTLDLRSYAASLMRRFNNPSLPHRLSQIAWDGSQKIPYRILGTVRATLSAGRAIDRLCVPIAAWLQFVRRRVRQNNQPVDPLAEILCAIASTCSGASSDVRKWLALSQVFPSELIADDRFVSSLTRAYERMDAVHGSADLKQALFGAL